MGGGKFGNIPTSTAKVFGGSSARAVNGAPTVGGFTTTTTAAPASIPVFKKVGPTASSAAAVSSAPPLPGQVYSGSSKR
jgi:hypothetical protein